MYSNRTFQLTKDIWQPHYPTVNTIRNVFVQLLLGKLRSQNTPHLDEGSSSYMNENKTLLQYPTCSSFPAHEPLRDIARQTKYLNDALLWVSTRLILRPVMSYIITFHIAVSQRVNLQFSRQWQGGQPNVWKPKAQWPHGSVLLEKHKVYHIRFDKEYICESSRVASFCENYSAYRWEEDLKVSLHAETSS